jgi:hypothetical protein
MLGLALLGEADLLTGQLICPRSPPDTIASFVGKYVSDEEWVVPGVCAYVPQVEWSKYFTSIHLGLTSWVVCLAAQCVDQG